MRRIIASAGIAAGAVIVALLLAEGVLRLAGFSFQPYPHFFEIGALDASGAPRGVAKGAAAGVFVPDRDLLWTSSDYAGRIEQARTQRPAMILLGDSCTAWGDYGERLAAIFETRSGGRRLPWANLAVGGWSSYQGLGALRRDVAPLAPRVVTLYFGWNDHWIRFGLADRVAAVSARLDLGGRVDLSEVRLVQLLKKVWIARQSRGKSPTVRVPLQDFRTNLRAMVRLCREHDIVPVLITPASSHEPGKEPPFLLEQGYLKDPSTLVPLHREYVQAVRDVAAAEDVPLCDLEAHIEALADRAGTGKARGFREDGIHLSDTGNEVLALRLWELLAERGLIGVLGTGARPQEDVRE